MPKNPPPAPARFASKFTRQPNGCWQWTAHLSEDGYGTFRAGKMLKAHRYSYELYVGPIPSGTEIDHKCKNRACVNPAHLEPVTHAENVRRGNANFRSAWTACPRGHDFTPDNTGWRKDGKRYCRICARALAAKYRAARQEDRSHASA